KLATILVALALVPATAAAQQQETAPPGQRMTLRLPADYRGLSADDWKSYCLWAGELYSIGSAFCSRQQTQSTCTAVSGGRPIWVNKENDKFCDKNPSLTPQ